ncbi:TPA: glutamine-hydrolyzing carbamoyl-phosphate synthase small subunit [Candidatus Woesearchaeota archaeon]|nr:glutamine-hydrolyzing carbamoyl-phosphate synthase small subunit [Candidatus Woesearchaeota archaeon]HIH42398.1 glutamine-hydrolyzing carbamoyl-phosphate synthase small subunit [Candidatus Woesearchaeota archaeon]
MFKSEKSAKLVLEDGSEFFGISFGADVSKAGEVVFNTGMVGYPETLTDPSYRGQILILTYPLIGNYGIPFDKMLDKLLIDFESAEIHVQGLVIADYAMQYNHWNSVKSLGEWLQLHNIPALCDIDTRALTKKIREKGVMLGKIVVNNNDIPFDDPNKRNLAAEVSCKEVIEYSKNNVNNEANEIINTNKKKILLVDCGVKNNIIRNLVARNLHVIRVPLDYDFLKEEFDAVFLTNGPGDPKMCDITIKNVKKALQQDITTFGICLGNQLLALAAGANTYKLKYGHRGQNQPCNLIGSKRCFITSQNHGFAVDDATLPEGWKAWFVNANDGSNEGIIHDSGLFKSVQFHPEAAPGPTDTQFLFDEFCQILQEKRIQPEILQKFDRNRGD